MHTEVCYRVGMSDHAPPSETRTHALAIPDAAAETVAPTAAHDLTVLRPKPARVPVPLDQPAARVRAWFDETAEAIIPDDDGTLATARLAADAYARRATAANTRRAYRAGVRAWCTWCDRHGLPCLPARAADVVAFLAAERGRGLSVTTVELRRAAIRYLHFICGCAVPTAEAQVAETMAGMHRTAAETGQLPARKLAATAEILRQISNRSGPTWPACATAPCCSSASPARCGAPNSPPSGSSIWHPANAACA